jgi:hypothetical protein
MSFGFAHKGILGFSVIKVVVFAIVCLIRIPLAKTDISEDEIEKIFNHLRIFFLSGHPNKSRPGPRDWLCCHCADLRYKERLG